MQRKITAKAAAGAGDDRDRPDGSDMVASLAVSDAKVLFRDARR